MSLLVEFGSKIIGLESGTTGISEKPESFSQLEKEIREAYRDSRGCRFLGLCVLSILSVLPLAVNNFHFDTVPTAVSTAIFSLGGVWGESIISKWKKEIEKDKNEALSYLDAQLDRKRLLVDNSGL